MYWAARQLLVPMNYLRIKHGQSLLKSKCVYDYILPLSFTILTVGAFLYLGVSLRLFDHEELIKRLNDLLALMIVFYMAALAAVATFDRKGIDNPLKGSDATLRVLNHDTNEHTNKVLSYRQFISYLFGYLSFLSLCLYIFVLIFAIGWPIFEGKFPCGFWHAAFKYVFDPMIFFLTFFALWQLTFTSLLGIYFLTERIQTLNDPEN